MLLPDRYESEATILVERQQVPERYVAANVTTDVREVLLVMTDAILSRTRLLQIIDEFDLFPNERKHLVPEELVDLMRSNIKVEPLQKGSAADIVVRRCHGLADFAACVEIQRTVWGGRILTRADAAVRGRLRDRRAGAGRV